MTWQTWALSSWNANSSWQWWGASVRISSNYLGISLVLALLSMAPAGHNCSQDQSRHWVVFPLSNSRKLLLSHHRYHTLNPQRGKQDTSAFRGVRITRSTKLGYFVQWSVRTTAWLRTLLSQPLVSNTDTDHLLPSPSQFKSRGFIGRGNIC